MQRLLKDIKSHKIEIIVAIKVDRLTRNNYDGFWLLNYCEEHDIKIELILEPYDVTTANGEMIFGMNLVFGQRERKEIGARTKRAMELEPVVEALLGKLAEVGNVNGRSGAVKADANRTLRGVEHGNLVTGDLIGRGVERIWNEAHLRPFQ